MKNFTVIARVKKNERCADVIYALSKLYYDKARDDYIMAWADYEKIMDKGDRRSTKVVSQLILIPDYSKALTSYQRSVKTYPDFIKSDEVYFQIGTILTLNGDLDGAKDAFTKLIHTHPNSIRASAGHFRLSEYNTWINLLTIYTGKINKNVFREFTLEKAHKKIFRLINNSDDFKLIKNVKLKDITNTRVLNDRLFGNYVSYIQQKYKGLKRKFDGSNDKDILSYDNNVFYWVEEDLLP